MKNQNSIEMDIQALRDDGFKGFETIENLTNTNCRDVPNTMGVYKVLNPKGEKKFRAESIGGHFKGRNPTISQDDLNRNWVEDLPLLYIGKAGGFNSNATLQKRLRQYMRFGQGVPVGHWGGRLIWQLENSNDLIVCWKTLDSDEPRDIERQMIQNFVDNYGDRPFANLTG